MKFGMPLFGALCQKPQSTNRAAATPEPISKPGQEEVLPEVIKDLEARVDLGIKKYGYPLQTYNGRDPLMDAYQEKLDDIMYTKQFLMERAKSFSLFNYLLQQHQWLLNTFGPGVRDEGLIKHIKKELKEIRDAPGDIEEWIDIILLGIEGALRNAKAETDVGRVNEVIDCLQMKQDKIFARDWPDWRTMDESEPIEHVKKK